MATFELEESDFAGYIDDGAIFPATVVTVKVVEKPYKDDDGNDVKKVEFKFVLHDENETFEGQNLWGETPTRFNSHPDCKLRNWSCAIMGQELEIGYRLDTDLLQGRDCRVQVQLYEYEDKKGPKNPDGTYQMKQRNRVVEVFPSREAMAAMASAGAGTEEPF